MRLPRRLRLLPLVAIAAMTLSCAKSPVGPNDNGWRFFPGRVESFSFLPFRGGRPCWIYLPPGYASRDRRYPVLYMNDGEVTFDVRNGMHVNRICEDLIRRGEIAPLIVVAIETGGRRLIEFLPESLDARGAGDLYLRAIRDTLKPEIDRRYRTLPDSRNTAIAGVSLGGLISAYAGFTHDSTFGKFGAFSPSYGYGLPSYARSHGRPRLLVRFYQDTGYPDDNWIGGMEEVAREQGFILGVDFKSVSVPGGEHTTGAWQHRFPNMLRFLFPP